MLIRLIRIGLKLQYQYRGGGISDSHEADIWQVQKNMINKIMLKLKYAFSTIKLMENKYMISLRNVNEYLKSDGG